MRDRSGIISPTSNTRHLKRIGSVTPACQHNEFTFITCQWTTGPHQTDHISVFSAHFRHFVSAEKMSRRAPSVGTAATWLRGLDVAMAWHLYHGDDRANFSVFANVVCRVFGPALEIYYLCLQLAKTGRCVVQALRWFARTPDTWPDNGTQQPAKHNIHFAKFLFVHYSVGCKKKTRNRSDHLALQKLERSRIATFLLSNSGLFAKNVLDAAWRWCAKFKCVIASVRWVSYSPSFGHSCDNVFFQSSFQPKHLLFFQLLYFHKSFEASNPFSASHVHKTLLWQGEQQVEKFPIYIFEQLKWWRAKPPRTKMPTFVAELTGELLRRTLQYDQYKSAETLSVGIYNTSSMLLLEFVQKPQTSEFQRGWESRWWSRCLANTWICCTCYLFKNIFALEGFPHRFTRNFHRPNSYSIVVPRFYLHDCGSHWTLSRGIASIGAASFRQHRRM